VRWLSADTVGVVVGRLVLTDPHTGTNVDGVYWRYETFLKECEASLGALLGANGAIYGFRRSLFVPMPPDTLVDDLVMPLLMKIRSGCGLVFDPACVAHEESPARRRSRIGAGAYGSLGVLWPRLSPTFGWTAFAFASHKVLRWFSPFLLAGALASNVLLAGHPRYRATLAIQAAFYATALVGAYVPGTSNGARLLRLPTLFTSVNVAFLVGFKRWLSGARGATWQRTDRGTGVAREAPSTPRSGRSVIQ
ncbi:MAG: glycosyltransferase family 2 protein, partial [Vicinamibacterales bacterium]